MSNSGGISRRKEARKEGREGEMERGREGGRETGRKESERKKGNEEPTHIELETKLKDDSS